MDLQEQEAIRRRESEEGKRALHDAVRGSASRLCPALDEERPPQLLSSGRFALTADDFPILGSHPHWEEGQVAVALSPTQADGGLGLQAAPAIGRVAADILKGVSLPFGDSSKQRLSPARESLDVNVSEPLGDTWEELGKILAPGKSADGRSLLPFGTNRSRTYFT
mmetsp:Transcript_19388/g.46235  ORF Transcript_19388/g.46235 Transcript_19388/m.46235 type:complete len:166 (-) Transcript_19388:80-577(-)